MSDDPNEVGLEHVLDAARDALLAGLHVCQPGRITDYDKATQRASVQPLVQRSHIQEDETEKVVTTAEVHDVIVTHMGPGRGRITFPIKVGDVVMLHHTSVPLDRWRIKGGLVNPQNDRTMDLSDAIAIAVIHDFAHVATDAPDDAIVMHCGDGVVAKIGGPVGTEKTIKGQTYRAAEDTLLTAIETSVGALSAAIAALSAAVPTLTGVPAAQAAWAAAVTAAAAAATNLVSAIAAFSAGASGYLAQKAEVL